MKGVKSYSGLYGEDSADQSSTRKGPPKNIKILISLVSPLKCCIPTSVGLWNEGMTNRSTVVEGSQKLFRVIWEDSADQSSTGEAPPKNVKILISLVRTLNYCISASVGL